MRKNAIWLGFIFKISESNRQELYALIFPYILSAEQVSFAMPFPQVQFDLSRLLFVSREDHPIIQLSGAVPVPRIQSPQCLPIDKCKVYSQSFPPRCQFGQRHFRVRSDENASSPTGNP